MSFYPRQQTLSRRFCAILESFLQKDSVPFADVLPEEEIQEAFTEEGCVFGEDEDCVYTPAVTLWAFLSQVLHKKEQRSCLAAVARVIVLMVALGREPCLKNSGAYCRARAKLSERVIQRLTLQVAEGCEGRLPGTWLWHGRHVKLADGTTVSLPDTPENQAQYPQQKEQQEGLGFPIIRLMVLLSLGTAMVCGAALAPFCGKETGEMALLRQLLHQLFAGDILLTDRLLCSYFLIAMLLSEGRDFVARIHPSRKTDFRRAKRLGRGDHLVVWHRPRRPEWMDPADYALIPQTLTVRLIEVHVDYPGFRTETFVVVTTLTDAREYPQEEITQLYHDRWQAELDIRAIKATLGMDVLRCKTPQMARKELWSCLLAYNLIRKAMLQAAHEVGRSPRELSFTSALQTIAASWQTLCVLEESRRATLIDAQRRSLAQQTIGDRPGRVEPRAVKRRPKPYPLLTKPREAARAELFRRPTG